MGESEYRGNYVQRKIKESIRFMMQKATIFYYRNYSANSVFTLILNGLTKVIFIKTDKKLSVW